MALYVILQQEMLTPEQVAKRSKHSNATFNPLNQSDPVDRFIHPIQLIDQANPLDQTHLQQLREMSGTTEEAVVKPEVDPLSIEATTIPGGFAAGGATGPGGFAQGTNPPGAFVLPGTDAEAPSNPVAEDAATMNQEETAVPAVLVEVKPPKPEEDLGEPIHEPHEDDILNGRGASVNAHRGNTKFRALCFARKPEFEAGNHAAKRRIATEIVNQTQPGRFLKRKQDKGPWYELSKQKAILKACQVMRDFQRPDRLALREMAAANGARKRQRTSESTPGVNAVSGDLLLSLLFNDVRTI